MKAKDFYNKLKKIGPTELISLFMKCEIYLTDKQLQKCIDLKKGTNAEEHGATSFKYRKKEEKC